MTISSAASPTPARRSRLLHRNLREDPPVAVGGHGVWLVNAQGREVLDGSGGAAVSCLGHQHPRVLEALASQAKELAYAHTSFFTTEVAEALADDLVGHEPGGLVSAYLVCGGSEAVETALKIARQYFLEIGQPQRTRIIARRQSYHGNTLGALAAGRHDGRREAFAPLLSNAFSHVSPAYAYREQRASEGERDLPPSSKPSSSGSAPTRSRRSSPSLSWAARRVACRPRRAISPRSAQYAIGTARCSFSTR
jgi:adenosylmethionine-8-amino-7-oxononanoate aminotransferase